MHQFYKELNGFVFNWRFVDDESWHGCLFLGLQDDGRTVIDPRSKRAELSYQTLKKCGEYFLDEDVDFDRSGKVLFFQGATDSAGTLLFDEQFWSWNNDGYVTLLGDSFTDYVQRGIPLGFCHMWESAAHPIPQAVASRLALEVELRKTFEVEVEVESVESFTPTQFRKQMGRVIPKGQFDKVMKALGRSEKAKDLDEVSRGEVFDDATSDLSKVNAKQAKAALSALFVRKKTKKAFVEHFRCGGEPLVQTRVRIKYLGGKGQVPLQEETTTVLRVLSELGLIDTDIPSDLMAYTYLAKMGIFERLFVTQLRIQDWKGRGSREAVFEFVFEKNVAQFLKVGSYVSTALPAVMSDIGA